MVAWQEAGHLSFEDAVAKHLPEFGKDGPGIPQAVFVSGC